MENDPKKLTPEEDKGLKMVIRALKESVGLEETRPLDTNDVLWLLERAMALFKNQPALLEVDVPVSICGDVHGQCSDLIRLLNQNGWPPKVRYLFLGDYIDRGPKNFETICMMFALRIRYPDHFHILRGNHEFRSVNRVYGFYEEMRRRYGNEMYEQFNIVFEWMPLAALVAGRILCMHGGISPDLNDMEQIRRIKRPLFEVPETGLVTDLLWADPDSNVSGFVPSTRGISYHFGQDVVVEFCDSLGLDLIVRAHQVVHKGFEFFADDRLVTVFSAPDYCGQFTNAGGILCIGEDLQCQIKQIPSRAAQTKSKT